MRTAFNKMHSRQKARSRRAESESHVSCGTTGTPRQCAPWCWPTCKNRSLVLSAVKADHTQAHEQARKPGTTQQGNTTNEQMQGALYQRLASTAHTTSARRNARSTAQCADSCAFFDAVQRSSMPLCHLCCSGCRMQNIMHIRPG